MTVKIHSPAGLPVQTRFEARVRPGALKGLRIGLLDNTKAPVDRMMRHLEARLLREIPGAKPFYIAKTVMSRAAEPGVVEELRQNADVLITGLAD